MLNFSKLENIIRKSLVGTGIVLGSYACAESPSFSEACSVDYSPLSVNEIVSLGVPVGSSTTDKEEYLKYVKKFQSEIINGLKERGNDIFDSDLTAKFYSELYAMPGNKKSAEEYLDYCKRAKEFMSCRLRDLKNITPEWVILEKGMDFQKNAKNRIFIADGFCGLDRVEFYKGKDLVYANSHKHQYSKGSTIVFEKGNFENWFIVLSMNFNTFSAPFAEILHITTTPNSADAYKGDIAQAIYAEETINNSLAYYLTLEFLEKSKISSDKNKITTNFLSMTSKEYKYVQDAMEYVNGRDINGVLRDYLDNPKAWFNKVTRGLDNLE